jgi:hypothetical protein
MRRLFEIIFMPPRFGKLMVVIQIFSEKTSFSLSDNLMAVSTIPWTKVMPSQTKYCPLRE